jgi:hypothetical protein
LNNSSLQSLLKRQFTFWNKIYIVPMVLATLLGTFLDTFLVCKQLYEFPIRPLPGIFSINIFYSFIGLPILVFMFLRTISQVNKWGRVGIILFVSLLMAIIEKSAEIFGLFAHSARWEHLYTFLGYLFFLTVISFFHDWFEKGKG